MKNKQNAFTLIELLVVVAIISILALIGYVNLENAVIKTKVTTAKNNLRVVCSALEAFHLDHNYYPIPQAFFPDDPFGILASEQLRALTTPISYCSGAAFRDPFGPIRAYSFSFNEEDVSADTDLPIPAVINPRQSIFYYNYHTFAAQVYKPWLDYEAVAVISIGPDLQDSFGVYCPFAEGLPYIAKFLGYKNGIDTLYDPTNGITSRGDIIRLAGELAIPNL